MPFIITICYNGLTLPWSLNDSLLLLLLEERVVGIMNEVEEGGKMGKEGGREGARKSWGMFWGGWK